MDLLERIAMFIFFGAVIWGLSKKFPLKDYRPQPLSWLDFALTVLGLGIVATYDYTVGPATNHLINNNDSSIVWLRDFFYASNPWVQFAAHVMLADFLAYWMHRLLHTRYVWPYHAFHHSPKSLNILSGMRGSPVHYMLVILPYTVSSCVLLYTGHPVIMIILSVIDVVIQHHTHSAIAVPYAKQIELLFITPRLHFVHHHPNPQYTNSNYGFIFSWWDKLFGTFTDPDTVEASQKGQLGLDYELSNLKLFLGFRRPKDQPMREAPPQKRSA